MNKKEIFKQVLIEHSVSNDYTKAVDEWQVKSLREYKECECICTQKIRHIRKVINTTTLEELIIGSCCINKFGISNIQYKTKLDYVKCCKKIAEGQPQNYKPVFDYIESYIKKGYQFYERDLKFLNKFIDRPNKFKAFSGPQYKFY